MIVIVKSQEEAHTIDVTPATKILELIPEVAARENAEIFRSYEICRDCAPGETTKYLPYGKSLGELGIKDKDILVFIDRGAA